MVEFVNFPGGVGNIWIPATIDATGAEQGAQQVVDSMNRISDSVQQANGAMAEPMSGDWRAPMGNPELMGAIDGSADAMHKVIPEIEDVGAAVDSTENTIVRSVGGFSNLGKAAREAGMGFAYMFASAVPGGYNLIRITRGLNSINSSLSDVSKGSKGAEGAVNSFGGTALKVFAVVTIAVAALAVILGVLVFMIVRWGIQMEQSLAQSLTPMSAFNDKMTLLQRAINNVHNAFQATFANLLNALLPYIMNFLNWLTNLLNTISMVIAALSGQNTVMLAVADSTTQVGAATEKSTKATKDATEAAKGALAAFDKINVLQQNKTPAVPSDSGLSGLGGGTGAGGGGLTLKQVPISQDILDKVAKFKQILADIANALKPVDSFLKFLKLDWDAWGAVIQKNSKPFSELVAAFVLFALILAAVLFPMAAIPILIGLIIVFVILLITHWHELGTTIRELGFIIGNWFATQWDILKVKAGEAWQWIVSVWAGASAWFQNSVTNPISLLFKNMVNAVITFINSMISAIVAGINAVIRGLDSLRVTIPGWVPYYGGNSWGLNLAQIGAPQIPHLATGAVIPPNAAFAAVLGDQTSGKNIETPESLMRQVFADVLRNNPQNVNISFTGTGAQIARMLKPELDKENFRQGTSLIKRTGSAVMS